MCIEEGSRELCSLEYTESRGRCPLNKFFFFLIISKLKEKRVRGYRYSGWFIYFVIGFNS